MIRKWILVARTLALASIVGAGAGCTPTQAYVGALKFNTAAAQLTMDARDGWHKFDSGYQTQIYSNATTRAEAVANLASWRTGTQSKVDAAFTDVRDGIATLSDLLNAAGAAQKSNYTDALAKLAGAVARLTSLLAQLGVHVPSLPALSSVLDMRLMPAVPPRVIAMLVAGGAA